MQGGDAQAVSFFRGAAMSKSEIYYEKKSTASHYEVIMGHTRIKSRWGKRHELVAMIDFWLFLPVSEQQLLTDIFCDSQSQKSYNVKLDIHGIIGRNNGSWMFNDKESFDAEKALGSEYAYKFGNHMGKFFVRNYAHHNGIIVSCGRSFEIWIDPGMGEFVKDWLF
jgi:hypothetical protein